MRFNKVLSLLFFLFFFIPNVSNAQALILVYFFGEKAATENFYFTLMGGANLSYFHNNIEGSSPSINGDFGLSASIRLDDKWYFSPEFFPFSKKRVNHVERLKTSISTIDNIYVGSHSSKTFSLLEFNLPFLYRLNENFSVGAGAHLAYVNSVSNRYYKDLDADYTIYRQDLTDDFHRFMFGFLADVNIGLTKEKWKGMGLKLRYSLNFNDLLKNNDLKAFQLSSIYVLFTIPFLNPKPKKQSLLHK